MNIVLVVDQYDHSNNGTTITARRFAEQLRKRGHTVKVLASGEPEPDKITVPTHTIPFFQRLVDAQGMCFAEPVDEAYYQAFKDADIVHFYMPFRFCRRGESIARQMHIPTIAAFHVQPENITSSIGLGKTAWANHFLYWWFKDVFYNRFRSIHCPSQFIAQQLQAHGYDSKLYVISNGVDEAFRPAPQSVPRTDNTFRILMIGRLSEEKRQDLMIKAAQLSRYRDKIQLIFAGKGPLQKKYEAMGAELPRKPIFGFYKQEELIELIHSCDLYVHASDAEIEGISCIEAFTCGLVPVISDSKLSATGQFALDTRCTFPAGDAQALAERMDYWLAHPNEKMALSRRYAAYGDSMRVDRCVQQAEQMYAETIAEWKKKGFRQPKENTFRRITHPNIEKAARNYGKGWAGKAWLSALLTNLLSPVMYLVDFLVWGFSIEGRENIRNLKGGAITVMNHIHPMDCTMVKLATFPRRLHYISMRGNLELPVIGWFLKACGATPLLDNTASQMLHLEKGIERSIAQGNWTHFYAEGLLVRYHKDIRPFHRGAFLAAVRTDCPVIPMRLVCDDPHGLRSLWRKKPFLRLIIGKPLYRDKSLPQCEAVNDLMNRTHQAMEALDRPAASEAIWETGCHCADDNGTETTQEAQQLDHYGCSCGENTPS